MPVFGVSALQGIRYGTFHQDANLAPALQFMCNNVFKSKRKDQIEYDNRLQKEKYDLMKSYQQNNDGLFNCSLKSKPSFSQKTIYSDNCNQAENMYDQDRNKYSFD